MIKTFENYTSDWYDNVVSKEKIFSEPSKYKIGDYVLITSNLHTLKALRNGIEGKIIDIINAKNSKNEWYRLYRIEVIVDDHTLSYQRDEEEIIRFLTPKEIEHYEEQLELIETKKVANKYNL
jgi:hypothetical protein